MSRPGDREREQAAATLAALRAEITSSELPVLRRARPARARVGGRVAALGAVALLAAFVVLGFVFAGSATTLAEGVQIAGVDVGGLTAGEARRQLEARSAELAATPVTFVAGSDRFRLTPAQLGVKVDWAAAVEAAQRQGEGFGPLQGFRRLRTRVFGIDVAPPTTVYDAALTYAVGEIAREVEQEPREAAIRLRGLRPTIVPANTGHVLDRPAAEGVVVRSLASFARAPVGLPVRVTPPTVTDAELAPALRQARIALSGPIRLDLGGTIWRLPRTRVAELLAPPAGGTTKLKVGGLAAERYLERVASLVAKEPEDASFAAASDGTVSVVPGRPGTALDRPATADAILAAATSRTERLAAVVVSRAEPELTTAEAKAMGIARVLTSYSTGYAGSADRINNLHLAVKHLDGALVAPGATFSFNERVGERTAERGFRSAPVIINDEYEDDIGGGVSQVATTVFNAAWEAGLKISVRAAHALYIGRYPLGRDATVNYPDLDLKFVNDTPKWILLRAFSTDSGITISLWGPPTGRRVESEAGPLLETGRAPIERVMDATLEKGTRIVEEDGEPPRVVTVTRMVYRADGSVLYDESWRTAYRGEKRIVRVGTKPPPPPEAEKEEEKEKPKGDAPATTTTTPKAEPAPPPAPPNG